MNIDAGRLALLIMFTSCVGKSDEEKIPLENALAQSMCECVSNSDSKKMHTVLLLDSCTTFTLDFNKRKVKEYINETDLKNVDDYGEGLELGAEFVKSKVSPILMQECDSMISLIKRYQSTGR